jgi:hypothetical protein
MVDDRQARYNQRKILVAILFSQPYLIFFVRAGIRKELTPGPYLLVIFGAYLMFTYFAGNAILRWMARRWP